PCVLLSRDLLPLSLLESHSTNSGRIIAELERLKDLRREGILDDAEFERLKRLIFARMESSAQ
ncbi:MAG: SHOCT domain-containing protein, partial [Thermodesulfobacteriota bacterium]|nr:SHOCT domain-containing protein [Thermodesulfobacteriota bacterium]